MTTFEELLDLAKKYGFKRSDIGRHIWGERNKTRIYLIKNPTERTLLMVKKGVDELISAKLLKNG